MNQTITHARKFLSDMENRGNSEFDAERALYFIDSLLRENEKAWAQLHVEVENEKRLEAELDKAIADLKDACFDGNKDFCRSTCANEGDLCDGCDYGEFWEYQRFQDAGGEEK